MTRKNQLNKGFLKKLLNNYILKIIPRRFELQTSQFLTNFARILAESHFHSYPEIEINGELAFLKDLPLPLKIVVDAGANRGDWSDALLSTNPNLDLLLLIEPNSELVNVLRRRFYKEKCVRITSDALDYRKDELLLSYSENADSHASLNNSDRSQASGQNLTSLTVRTNTIDSLFEKLRISSIDLLKLDLEGFDHYALLGARKALMQNKIKVIQFEVTRAWETTGCSPCATFRLLTQAGFRLCHLRPTGLELLDCPSQIPHFSLYSNFCAIEESIYESYSLR